MSTEKMEKPYKILCVLEVIEPNKGFRIKALHHEEIIHFTYYVDCCADNRDNFLQEDLDYVNEISRKVRAGEYVVNRDCKTCQHRFLCYTKRVV